MKKLLAAIVAGMFALSSAPAVLAAKHEMKKEQKAMKAEAKKAAPKGKAMKGEGKKTEGKAKAKKGSGKKKEK